MSRVTSIFDEQRWVRLRPHEYAPPRPYYQPVVATDAEHGYRVRESMIQSLVAYDGGKNALSLGPHHNRLSQLQNVGRKGGVEVSELEVFRRKVDARIEILSAALYAEGYSIADVARHSEHVFGVSLRENTIYQCIRRAFGINYRKLSKKQRAAYLERAHEALQA